MSKLRELYRIENLPIFQNKGYDSPEEAINCLKGDVVLVKDLETGLVYNCVFRPEVTIYDEHYQNEQAHSLNI